MTNSLTNVVSSPAAQETNHHAGYGEQLLQSAPQVLIGLAVGLFLGWRAHIFACRRESTKRVSDAKDRFLAVIASLTAKLDGCEHIDSRTQVFHAESLPLLREAVFALQPFVSTSSFQRILDLWHDYERHRADAGSFLTAQITQQHSGGQTPPYPDDALRFSMRRFREEVGHAV